MSERMNFDEATLVAKKIRRTEGISDALPVPGEHGNDWKVQATTALGDVFPIQNIEEMNTLLDAVAHGEV